LWFNHCDTHFYSHCRLTGSNSPLRKTAGWPSNSSQGSNGQHMRGSKNFGRVQKILYNLEQGPNTMWQISRSPAVPSQNHRRRVIRCKHTSYMYPLPYHFPHFLLWFCGLRTELCQLLELSAIATPILSCPSLTIVSWARLSVHWSCLPSFEHLFPLLHFLISHSSFLGQPLSNIMFLYWLWVYPQYTLILRTG